MTSEYCDFNWRGKALLLLLLLLLLLVVVVFCVIAATTANKHVSVKDSFLSSTTFPTTSYKAQGCSYREEDVYLVLISLSLWCCKVRLFSSILSGSLLRVLLKGN
jgi:uncharacterized protein YpmS